MLLRASSMLEKLPTHWQRWLPSSDSATEALKIPVEK